LQVSELWRPAEHEPLAPGEWDETRAEEAIRTIVADAEAAFDGGRWPWHPRDGDDDGPTCVYLGAAGVIWALHELGSRGWEGAAVGLVDRYRAEPDMSEYASAASYWGGECGIALVAFRLTGDAGLADRVHELVLQNPDSETNEVMWGTPGTMLVAEAMLAWTGEPRWDEAWRASAERLLAARDEDGLWTQDMYGTKARYLGPAHGYAGIVRACANRGTTVQLADLAPYVLREDGVANWKPTTEARPDQIRVQWCHGAPGMVATLGDLLELELALAGGELTWRAGPLAKGSGLCHGTAGNAFAFLALHRRTGDGVWLDRARAFAMHAIGQVERERAELGRGRYSLFTGDIGVALFLRHLLNGDDRFPTLGPFDA
jgi:Lanthionine synthetase C-like protein